MRPVPSKSTRLAIASALLLSCAALGAQPDSVRDNIETYSKVIEAYRSTGNAAEAVKPLLRWNADQFAAAVESVLRRADPTSLEAAAALQLEIGIAVVGLSEAGAALYFEHGSRLINAVMPPAAIRKGLSAERLQEITDVGATWHRVAASAFLSVNDELHARTFAGRARALGPKSAATLTVVGAVDEVAGELNNPDNWDALIQMGRALRERQRLLLRAEESYKAAIEADPEYPLAYIRRGRVEFLRRNFKAARPLLERGSALAREPRHQYLAAMFTGALQQAQNDLGAARASFERALAIAPQSQNAVAALSFVELMAGRTGRAEEIARAYTGTKLDDAWWAYKTGALDIEGLQWLRQRVRR